MRRFSCIALFLLGSFTAAQADGALLLWDNYQGPVGYDHISARSSERNTIVTDSWTADDAIFSAQDYPFGVSIQEIKWIGMRDPFANYMSADFIILDDGFNVISEVADLPYTVNVLGSDFGLQTYEGSIAVPDVVLTPGRYYFAARLSNGFLGQNFVATTGQGNIQGVTVGAFQSYWFGYPGQPGWVLVSEIPSATVSDFAYRIYGVPVPEPASLATLLIGGLALLRKR